MQDNLLKQQVAQSYKTILMLRSMFLRTLCPIQKVQIVDRILYEIDRLLSILNKSTVITEKDEGSVNLTPQRVFTLDELAKYNGSEGNPAYVAVNGVVYDVSRASAWGGGTHFSLYAGKDLTTQFADCHKNSMEILKKLPIVGTLKA